MDDLRERWYAVNDKIERHRYYIVHYTTQVRQLATLYEETRRRAEASRRPPWLRNHYLPEYDERIMRPSVNVIPPSDESDAPSEQPSEASVDESDGSFGEPQPFFPPPPGGPYIPPPPPPPAPPPPPPKQRYIDTHPGGNFSLGKQADSRPLPPPPPKLDNHLDLIKNGKFNLRKLADAPPRPPPPKRTPSADSNILEDINEKMDQIRPLLAMSSDSSTTYKSSDSEW
jgi:hypothetical protein